MLRINQQALSEGLAGLGVLVELPVGDAQVQPPHGVRSIQRQAAPVVIDRFAVALSVQMEIAEVVGHIGPVWRELEGLLIGG